MAEGKEEPVDINKCNELDEKPGEKSADLNCSGVDDNFCNSQKINPENESLTKTSAPLRKEDNPFSFKHFLKRDLSSNGTISYENTGAKPKVYPSVAHRSPTKLNVYDSKKSSRGYDAITKDWSESGPSNHYASNTSSSNSVELPFGLTESTDSKHNLYTDTNEIPFNLGMPSLPDFVQDHLLVEQVYLNCNTPVTTVDLENLPDFTFTANYVPINSKPSNTSKLDSSKINEKYSYNSNFDYDLDMPSTSHSSAPFSSKSVPLDLPANRVGENSEYSLKKDTHKVPLDVSNHLNLDLTESLSANTRRSVSPNGTFPFDLPISSNVGTSNNSSNDNLRLPDFLPVHSGSRHSPERHQTNSRETHGLHLELNSIRSELFRERRRSDRLQLELNISRSTEEALRQEVKDWKQLEAELRKELSETKNVEHNYTESLASSIDQVENNMQNVMKRALESESMVARLKQQVKQLKEEISSLQRQLENNQSKQRGVTKTLRLATNTAEISLRELLSGLEQLRGLASTLDPP